MGLATPSEIVVRSSAGVAGTCLGGGVGVARSCWWCIWLRIPASGGGLFYADPRNRVADFDGMERGRTEGDDLVGGVGEGRMRHWRLEHREEGGLDRLAGCLRRIKGWGLFWLKCLRKKEWGKVGFKCA